MESVFFVIDLGKLNSILRYLINMYTVLNWTNKNTASAKKLKLKGASREMSSKEKRPTRRSNTAVKNGKVAIKVNKFCPLVIVNLFI